jgi:ATP-dependent DNA ligase
MQTEAAEATLKEFMMEVLERGGEGAILRKPESIWEPKRSWNLLKVKPWADDEAKVLGYVWGKGKLEGLMGALVVEWAEKKFELSGFSNAERELLSEKLQCSVSDGEPGMEVPDVTFNPLFPRGSMVTFQWCGHLTDDGKPKEARYYRKPA